MKISREKRNVAVLAACQGLQRTSATILVILSGLVGASLVDNRIFATVPVSATMIGTALAIVPASLLMKTMGRRAGFVLGALIGGLGAIIAAGGIFMENFWLFVAGTFAVGVYAGFAQYYRFAAADAASPKFRGKAISLVVAGGIIGAVAGPELVNWSNGLFVTKIFLGSYLTVAVLALADAGIHLTLYTPKIDTVESRESGRPIGVIMRQPAFLVAVLVGMTAYGVTVFLMTATPLAMADFGHDLGHTALVIQWHTVAMFAPAFVTGSLIDRFGVLKVMFAGVALLAGSLVIAVQGSSLELFWVALAALGIGWNFTFIGASTLLMETYRPEERAKAQAANDLLVFGAVAATSLLSGTLLYYFDWATVNVFAIPLVLLSGAVIGWHALSQRAGQAAA
jgi:MFS family permease